MAVVESSSNDTGCGTHFSLKQSPNGNSAFTNFDAAVTWQSHATPRGSGWKSGNFQILGRNFVGNLAVISETRGEVSFEVCFESFLRLTCRVFRKDRRAFEDRSEGKRSGTMSWSTRGRLSGRLWLSLVRLSMFRHLFIDLLEYGGVRVLSMLNFYSSCLRLYFEKVLDYDSMSLDIIEYPYLVVYMIILI
ncbi:hypothetical protein H5410_001351 [Solanum commersonii]|uniref:Uncharacterized protein n=1 Tax=Solanum commersonii TaxID=4109 RepID=A0A9J6AZA4_SOLCO|nr:hypothetical protein H5410_001351 [Solanum commersonii]